MRKLFRTLQGGVLVLAAWLAPSWAVQADAYRLQPGDVLEFSIVGAPDLRHRATVSVDGVVSFPLVGDLAVTGSELLTVQQQVRDIVSSKMIYARDGNGRADPMIVPPDGVTVSVAEYRPVYAVGDVLKPGELPFRPGMTVRQVIALAGGFDTNRARVANPHFAAADLSSEAESLQVEEMALEARLARLQSDLNGRSDIDPKLLRPSIARLPGFKDVLDREAQQLTLEQQALRRDKASLQRELDAIQGQASGLAQQKKLLEQSVQQQSEETARIRGANDKGLASNSRLSEEQRALLYASERLLQMETQQSQAMRAKEDITRQLQRIEDERRVRLIKDVQDSNVRLSSVRFRLEGVHSKLSQLGHVGAQAAREAGADATISLVRRVHGKPPTSLSTNQDSEVQPGDWIQVRLPPIPPGGPQQRY